MQSLACNNSECQSMINEAYKLQRERLTMCHPELGAENFSSLFKHLLENITVNANKVPQAKRHDHIIKKFSTSLLIYAGPRAYNFLQRNIPDGLPCLRTVQRTIRSEYKPMREGEFLFDDLLNHLNSYNANKVVAIAEDATRVIARVDYDSEAVRVVGFVLPCDNNGLPLCDSFIATSFSAIESMFKENEVAKFAYVYMAQAISKQVPAFCLACIGTNNRFSTDDVLKRWKHVYLECKAHGITVVSFGANGDTRALKAMKSSCQLLDSFDKCMLKLSPSSLLEVENYSKDWCSWFKIQHPTNLAYVQDPVHVGVKLKTRVTKPSIILPLGNYLAGIHHLRMIFQNFSKDQHGMHITDIDHKDKQNFEAVMRITGKPVLKLLQQIPDAKGTLQYLNILRSIVDSYLDESITPLSRIYKAWYGVFFLRFWRQWLLQNKNFTIENNFISLNSYYCTELNAHSLISLLRISRDNGYQFLPWLHGSQSCEQLFRTMRSMSSTFSTVINFGLLGLLRRLHR